MIECSKCNGKMFVDTQFTTERHIELSCIRCGKRTFYNNTDNPVIAAIVKNERAAGRVQ